MAKKSQESLQQGMEAEFEKLERMKQEQEDERARASQEQRMKERASIATPGARPPTATPRATPRRFGL